MDNLQFMRDLEMVKTTTLSGHEMRKNLNQSLKEPCIRCGNDTDSFSPLTLLCSNCSL